MPGAAKANLCTSTFFRADETTQCRSSRQAWPSLGTTSPFWSISHVPDISWPEIQTSNHLELASCKLNKNEKQRLLSSSDPRPDPLFWHSFWHTIWKSFFLGYTLTTADISGFWHTFWHTNIYIYILTISDIFWHILTFFLAFYLAYLLTSSGILYGISSEILCGWGPAGNTLILCLLFGSGGEHFAPEVAVRGRWGTLRSSMI